MERSSVWGVCSRVCDFQHWRVLYFAKVWLLPVERQGKKMWSPGALDELIHGGPFGPGGQITDVPGNKCRWCPVRPNLGRDWKLPRNSEDFHRCSDQMALAAPAFGASSLVSLWGARSDLSRMAEASPASLADCCRLNMIEPKLNQNWIRFNLMILRVLQYHSSISTPLLSWK